MQAAGVMFWGFEKKGEGREGDGEGKRGETK